MKRFYRVASAALLFGAVVASPQASAASYVDTSVAAAFTQYGSDVTTLAGYAWPVVLLCLGIAIAIKLVKRFANKV